jgi:colanic acid biosynthesis glycosyl transferase WcaI
MNAPTLPLTVLIAARNEELNLPKCLAALTPAAQVIVLDSQSTDHTAEIARRHGAEVVQFYFRGGMRKKRQWALDTLHFPHEWILLLDADEIVPLALWEEIRQAITRADAADAYLITKGFHFLGRRLKHGGFSHAAVLLVRRGRARFEQLLDDDPSGLDMEVHERLIVDGPIGRLRTPLVHEDFKGLQAYLDRHNRYSTWEARVRGQWLRTGRYGHKSVRARLFGNAQQRRRFLKRLAVRMPLEPLLWFLYHYLARLGILEGRRGLIASLIRADYIAQVRAKMYELRLSEKAAVDSSPREKPTLAIISQVYVPDPAAVGQQMADAAVEIARRGLRVVVLTSRAGYDDARRKYPKRETHDGVEVRRLAFSSFGKASIPRRLLGAASFLTQVTLRTLMMRNLHGVLVSTSPPMCALAALAVAAVRRVPIIYWAMDLNPDQAVALGAFRAESLPVRALDRMNRAVLRKAERIVALDAYMAERLAAKTACDDRLVIIPPWPLETAVAPVPHQENPFRREHGLDDKFVVMYSGNMSLAHPLDTILAASALLADRREVVFLFIGGGQGRRQVDQFLAERAPRNVRLLPYQPLEQLHYSLSAADVHVVSMGQNMVGIVHPCKIYNIMACGRPVLLVGPRESHAGELVSHYDAGMQVEHGDANGAAAAILQLAAASPAARAEIGRRARSAIEGPFSKAALCQAFCDEVETAVARSRFFTGVPITAVEDPSLPAVVAEPAMAIDHPYDIPNSERQSDRGENSRPTYSRPG